VDLLTQSRRQRLGLLSTEVDRNVKCTDTAPLEFAGANSSPSLKSSTNVPLPISSYYLAQPGGAIATMCTPPPCATRCQAFGPSAWRHPPEAGSLLTELGPPTRNLFCGEHNGHGPLEWVAVQDIESAVTACAHLAELWEGKG